MNKTKIALYSQLQRLWVKENKKEEVINILTLSTFFVTAILFESTSMAEGLNISQYSFAVPVR